MAEVKGTVGEAGAGVADSGYRTSMEVLTRRGGIFWGLVLLILGVVWFAANLFRIPLDFGLLIPLLVILAGLYLLITKVVR